ncbi:MAG TPA: DNA-binding response regulator, partial [Myxococcales bacterium]|nr:DNA-binding response regulator [Myxococcales bacterium]
MIPDPEQRPRVLVIEDTAEVRRAVKRSLKSLGMDVEVADSGEEGLRLVEALRPNLVLTDVNMPGMDGF